MTASAMPESRWRSSWWCRPSLSRRIAAAMFLSLIAIQAQAFLQIRYLSDPELRLVGTRWLAVTTADVARGTFARPAAGRAAFAASRSDPATLAVTWAPSLARAEPDDSAGPIAARLRATLESVFGAEAASIRIAASAVAYRFPTRSFRLVVVASADNDPVKAEPIRPGEPDVLIPAGVRIDVQGRDGSWLTVEPIGTADSAFGASLPYVPLLIGGLIVALVSTLTARHLLAPLDALVAAANRVGASREPVTIPRTGLHEFAAVAQAFEDMQQRLMRFVDDRTQMLAAMSHDLRSALTRLRLATEDVPEAGPRAALAAEIEDMQAMVEQTLAFASGEARAVPDQRVDLASMLISLVDEAADTGEPCSYEGPDHAEIMGHPVALKRAFRNLIDNALKYGGAARVIVSVEVGRLTVDIEDDGPGIPADRLEEAFAPFRRLDPARTAAGVGLGLTIARDVVLAHGGTISAEGGQGDRFKLRVALPRASARKIAREA